MDKNDPLFPIMVLIEELSHEETSLRLNAVNHLPTIALALGVERTRNELIPFLNDSLVDDEDEVLLALATQLAGFGDFVGGPDHLHTLLPPLETLAAVEESTVREKAVESLCTLAKQMKEDGITQHLIPFVMKMASSSFFTGKASSCGLFAPCYMRAGSQQGALKEKYVSLCKDDSPIVRRAAAQHLKDLVKEMPKSEAFTDGVAMFKQLATDEHDSVRILSVPAGISLAEILAPEETKSTLLQTVKNLASDKSWRVRYMAADCFVDLSKACGSTVTNNEFVPIFVSLLKDQEGEVRTAAASKIPGFCHLITLDLVKSSIIPCVKDLVSDSSQHVRASLALQISGLAPIVGKAETIDRLLPMFLQLLKDSFPDVRLNVISKLDILNEVIGMERLSQSLFPAIGELAEDKQWRVRLAIIEYIPLLAKQLGVEFFEDKLNNLCMSWLGDCVYSIREASTQNLRKLAEVFGAQWAQTSIVPKVISMSTHPNYLYRMTTLFAIANLSEVLTPQTTTEALLPVVLSLASDPIPNIRFNVAKTLGVMAPRVTSKKSVLTEQVKPSLDKLAQDKDQDVRFYARTSLQIISNLS